MGHGVLDVDQHLAVSLVPLTGYRQAQLGVASAVQDEQKGDRKHGEQLRDEGRRSDGHVLQRAGQLGQLLGQVLGIADELRRDVVPVVEPPDRRVAAQLICVVDTSSG